MFYCCFCRKTCPRLCNNFEVVDLIDQDRMPSKEKITCSDGVVNLLFLICHLGFIGLQFLIIVDLMSNRAPIELYNGIRCLAVVLNLAVLANLELLGPGFRGELLNALCGAGNFGGGG